MIKNCFFCNKLFKTFPCKVNKGNGKYCSKLCNLESVSVKNNFFNKVKKDNCWIWTGCVGRTGYGKIFINKKFKSAHRFSWEQTYGEIPEG